MARHRPRARDLARHAARAAIPTPERPSSPASDASAERATASARPLAVQSLMDRLDLVRRVAGQQFMGARDIYTAAGYLAQGGDTFADYWALYTRGGIAGRIVDMPATTTWRRPPEIVEDGYPDGTPFTRALQTLAARLKLWSYCQRVDQLAGVGRYAVLMLGAAGTEDASLATPLTSVRGPNGLAYLALYSEENARIQTWETDPTSARFGMPRVYQLRIAQPGVGIERREQRVHASRVLHVAEGTVEDDVYGRPRLQRALNHLFDLEKVSASTGEAYWQLVSRILQASIDPAMEMDADQVKALDEGLSEMVHDLRRQFFGRGVTLDWLQSETPNVSEVAEFYFSLLAGDTGIPKRILFGAEQGELASTQDQATWHGRIAERQVQFAEPCILRPFVDRCLALGALPRPVTGTYGVVWPPLAEPTGKDRAAISLTRAQTAAALTPVGGNPRELVRIDSEGDVYLDERAPDAPVPLDPSDELPADEPPAPPNDGA